MTKAKGQRGAWWVAKEKGQIMRNPNPKKNWTIGRGVTVSKIEYSPGSTKVEGTAGGKPFAINL